MVRLLDAHAGHPAAGRLMHARHSHKAALLKYLCEELRSSPRPTEICHTIVFMSQFWSGRVRRLWSAAAEGMCHGLGL